MISGISLGAALAWAADVAPAAQGSAPSMLTTFLPFIAIFAVMYFLMIRPQQKKQKEHQNLLDSIQRDDRVQTNGGLFGTVTGIDKEKNELTLEIAPQVRVKLGRSYIVRVIRPGSPPDKKS